MASLPRHLPRTYPLMSIISLALTIRLFRFHVHVYSVIETRQRKATRPEDSYVFPEKMSCLRWDLSLRHLTHYADAPSHTCTCLEYHVLGKHVRHDIEVDLQYRNTCSPLMTCPTPTWNEKVLFESWVLHGRNKKSNIQLVEYLVC